MIIKHRDEENKTLRLFKVNIQLIRLPHYGDDNQPFDE